MNLGLKKGNVIQFVLSVNVQVLKKARHEWARLTGHLDPNWNNERGTYGGFPVVKTRKTSLNRGETKPLFYY